jgi:hypothetical protein
LRERPNVADGLFTKPSFSIGKIRENEFMIKKLLWKVFLFAWAFGIVSCAGLESMQKREEIYGKAIPVIHQTFAADQIWPGQTWKVYLNASDPDGDMESIVCAIDQPGVGIYPASITKISEENQKELSGYIFLNTQVLTFDLTFENLTLTVQIRDKAGHYSPPAMFPLFLNASSQQASPPPGFFKEIDLGPIMIQLRSIQDGNERGFHRGTFSQ